MRGQCSTIELSITRMRKSHYLCFKLVFIVFVICILAFYIPELETQINMLKYKK